MKLSVIIPVHNGGEQFKYCLDALRRSTRTADEIIVVNDGSTDDTAATAANNSCRVINLDGMPRGAALARNRGADEATGDVLVFLDADVAVHTDTLWRIEMHFQENPEIAALFGSYDDNPPVRNIVSLYKNLQHHYVHQKGKRKTFTFWTGCGAVRRNIFVETGGFDEARAKRGRPLMEDIEFGMRMVRGGHVIMLFPDVQVVHFKRWTLTSWLRTEIFNRALPWSKLILANGEIPDDLNVERSGRVSALAAWLLVFFLISTFFIPVLWMGAGLSLFVILLVNSDFYLFLSRRGGVFFGMVSVALHTTYFLYSSAVFGIALVYYRLLPHTGTQSSRS